jgi:hypothetical protein
LCPILSIKSSRRIAVSPSSKSPEVWMRYKKCLPHQQAKSAHENSKFFCSLGAQSQVWFIIFLLTDKKIFKN